MKIYTRTGDEGSTSLFGGGRVGKDHARIEAYGSVDELNSFIGLARSRTRHDERLARLNDLLRRIQGELLVVGADLATPHDARANVPRVTQEMVDALENFVDRYEEDLTPLRNFILPAGNEVSATLHLSRTVARRGERAVVLAARTEELNKHVIVYLNRLSDLLFVLARWAAHQVGDEDEVWQGS